MDIVSRLKTFITYMSIPVTQFADACRIPRPTLSQLLNGRNKKVSDELIGKIHEAYPQLSVLWLMFGEGEMLHGISAQTSAASGSGLFDFETDETPSTSETVAPRLEFDDTFQPDASGSIRAEKTESPALSSQPADVNSTPLNPDVTEMKTTVSFDATTTKKIVNIIVYYNDNSFESFIPSPEK